MAEQLWFSEVSNEIVDDNSTNEKEIVEEINTSLASLQYEQLAENWLENLNKDQLSTFLAKNYFEWGAKTYSEYKDSWQILNFSMKSALQFLAKNNTQKFDDNWNETNNDNWKTATELLKNKWWIDLDNDKILIKVLQKIVWAYPDGKPGPQTIALTISALGGDISGIYEWVNDIYTNNEKFKVKNISTFKIWETDYKYDKNQFDLTNVDWNTILTVSWESNWKKIEIVNWNPNLAWFTFENWWIKKVNKSNTPTTNAPTTSTENNNGDQEQNNTSKHDKNPKIPDNWDENIEEGVEYTEATSDFIKNNNNKLSFTEWNKKEYLSLLDSILNYWPKSATLYSLIKLDNKFWKNYRLTYDDLKNFNENAGKNTWRGFDATRSSSVFHPSSSNNNDYLIYRDNKIIRENEGSSNGNTFEVDGTHNWDDERFNSVECFCKYIAGVNIERARKNVRNLAKENNNINYRSEKINPEVIKKSATLKLVWFWDDSDEWLKKRKTFISLLELPEHFWWNYKLNENDIKNFAQWMSDDIFDRWNSTVFHTEWVGKKWINKNKPMFEVDGSASGNHRSDRRFASVENFFYKLGIRVNSGEWPK